VADGPKIWAAAESVYVGSLDGDWHHIGYTDTGGSFEFEVTPEMAADAARLAASPGTTSVSVTVDLDTENLRVVLHVLDRIQRPRWHRRRCPICRPAGFITGPNPAARGYHRRQQARRRRNRGR
jgi:hypothetical protein